MTRSAFGLDVDVANRPVADVPKTYVIVVE